MATSLKVADALKDRVQGLAERSGRSPHRVMVEAIEQYVERAEARERFHQEALTSWQHYQETGLHLTWDEVRDWLSRWGTQDEAPLPECHT